MRTKTQIASLPEFDRLVAEIWIDSEQIALLTNEDPAEIKVILYENGLSNGIEFGLLLSCLESARQRMLELDAEP